MKNPIRLKSAINYELTISITRDVSGKYRNLKSLNIKASKKPAYRNVLIFYNCFKAFSNIFVINISVRVEQLDELVKANTSKIKKHSLSTEHFNYNYFNSMTYICRAASTLWSALLSRIRIKNVNLPNSCFHVSMPFAFIRLFYLIVIFAALAIGTKKNDFSER